MRLAFLGTPDAAVASLEALLDAGHEIVLVVTRPDRRRGRGGALVPSPVKRVAEERGLAVAHDLGALDATGAERGVVVAFGAMVPPALLARLPMLNVHFSLLPRWRGAAPVARAILAGDELTGVDVISLEAELDTGPVHAEATLATGEKTLSELTDELARVGAALVVRVLADEDLLAHPRPQVGEATYAKKLSPPDFALRADMSVVEAARVARLERSRVEVAGRSLRVARARARALDEVTPGRLDVADGEVRLHVGDGALVLEQVQPESGRVMDARAWLSGARLDLPTRWQAPDLGPDQ